MKNTNQNRPPRLAEALMKRLLPRAKRDSLSGDFEEFYHEKLTESGLLSAYFWYWMQVFRSVPLFISEFIFWGAVMYKNYCIAAMRSILRGRLFSIINIFGLSLGLAVSILIYFYIHQEYSYDRFHIGADCIFEVYGSMKFGDKFARMNAQPPLGPELELQFRK